MTSAGIPSREGGVTQGGPPINGSGVSQNQDPNWCDYCQNKHPRGTKCTEADVVVGKGAEPIRRIEPQADPMNYDQSRKKKMKMKWESRMSIVSLILDSVVDHEKIAANPPKWVSHPDRWKDVITRHRARSYGHAVSLYQNHMKKSGIGAGSNVPRGTQMNLPLESFKKGDVAYRNNVAHVIQDYDPKTQTVTTTRPMMPGAKTFKYPAQDFTPKIKKKQESTLPTTKGTFDPTHQLGVIRIECVNDRLINLRAPDRILDNVNAWAFFNQWEQYLPRTVMLNPNVMSRIAEWWKYHSKKRDVLEINCTTGSALVKNRGIVQYSLGTLGTMRDPGILV